ncbi:MAG: phytanoyl-CoA dioxygenase family protein [Streptosporangiaceae bacterium]
MHSQSSSDLRSVMDQQGYVIVDDVLSARTLNRMLDAIAIRTVEYGQEMERAGHVSGLSGSGLSEQLISIVRSGQTWPGQVLDIALPQGGIACDTPIFLEEAAFELVTDPKLLDLVEQFVGPEIWLSPVGHTRVKVPHDVAPRDNGRFGTTVWHQDNGVLLAEADDLDILTVWVPLREATVENGCMCVVPTPRQADLIEHCGAGLGIPASNMPETTPVALPMRAGSVLLLHQRTVHASLPNVTADDIRISMDLRYQSLERPSGRPQFPSFLVRSPSDQARLTTWPEWRTGWIETRDRLADQDAGPFNRWTRLEGCA